MVSSQEKVPYDAGTDPRRKTVVGNVRRNRRSTSMFAETLTFGHSITMVFQIFFKCFFSPCIQSLGPIPCNELEQTMFFSLM